MIHISDKNSAFRAVTTEMSTILLVTMIKNNFYLKTNLRRHDTNNTYKQSNGIKWCNQIGVC